MTVYTENPKELTKNKNKNPLLELINEYTKVEGYKVNIQSQLLSYMLEENKWNLKFKKPHITIYISTLQNEIL